MQPKGAKRAIIGPFDTFDQEASLLGEFNVDFASFSRNLPF